MISYYNSRIPTSLSSIFITLVFKKDLSIKVHDLRSISLISRVYKVIAKAHFVKLGEVLRTLSLRI